MNITLNVGVIRYPGSNCDRETLDYFGIDNSFYIWHTCEDINVLDNLHLLVLPGGFAFGDRVYNKATEEFMISPGTMALNSPVTKLLTQAVAKNIPIIEGSDNNDEFLINFNKFLIFFNLCILVIGVFII